MEPILPILPGADPILAVLIQKNVVTLGSEPLLHFDRMDRICAGIADEDLGHRLIGLIWRMGVLQGTLANPDLSKYFVEVAS